MSWLTKLTKEQKFALGAAVVALPFAAGYYLGVPPFAAAALLTLAAGWRVSTYIGRHLGQIRRRAAEAASGRIPACIEQDVQYDLTRWGRR